MKKGNIAIVVLILILFIVVIGLALALLLYDSKDNDNYSDKEDNNVQNIKEECKEENISNSFEVYAKNLKNQIRKYNSNNLNSEFVDNGIIKDGYTVYIDNTGSLFIEYFNKALNDKYGVYKIADNVLTFYIIKVGQGGGNMLYFVNDNGTVGSADVEYGVKNENAITIKKEIGFQNIVSIVNGSFGDGHSGASAPIFIDVNGNIYSDNIE